MGKSPLESSKGNIPQWDALGAAKAATVLSLYANLSLAGMAFCLFFDGVYFDSADGSSPRFRWVKAPTSAGLTQLTHTLAQSLLRNGHVRYELRMAYRDGTTPVIFESMDLVALGI